MDGFRVPETPSLGHPHRVDVANEVRNGGVRRREFLHVAFRTVAPGYPQPVALGQGKGAGMLGNRIERVFIQFGPLDDG